MCSISGLYYFDHGRIVDEWILANMSAVATHRGPDAQALHREGNVGLSFNRLSIIDPAGGSQPMTNESGDVSVVFNGEIYNFGELRSELNAKGWRFHTRSDTEVLLRSWEEYGEDCVSHLRGMFAFAIWDRRRCVLFGARDRIGIKPFYYFSNHEMFAFASEIKSLLEAPGVTREVDDESIAEYLRHGFTPTPHTLFRDIYKLPPAHTITVRAGKISIRRYWDIPMDEGRETSERQALNELESLLDETIRLHLNADVPLGVFLSGGIDSSSIVAVMARLGVRDIKTFSVGYDEQESELNYARLVAEHFRTDHEETCLTASLFRDLLPQVVWHLDEPVADAPSTPLFHLSRIARSKVTTVLSGEGADEIFGGYPAYARMLMIDTINRLPLMQLAGQAIERWVPPGKLRKNGAMLGRPLEARYRAAVIFDLDEITRLQPGRRHEEDSRGALAQVYSRCRMLPSLARMSYVDFNTWLPNDLLLKADRMTMAHSLELRVPFLDHPLVEFMARLPGTLKVRRFVGKYLLKHHMKTALPSPILTRAKKGFSIPTKTWFRNELAGFVRETLLTSNGACLRFFEKSQVARVLDEHHHRDRSDQIYALLAFNEWHRLFMTPQKRKRPPKSVEDREPATLRLGRLVCLLTPAILQLAFGYDAPSWLV